MIKVKVFTPFGYGSWKLDDRGWIELPEGTTFGTLVHKLGMPTTFARVFKPLLNGEKAPFSTKLKDGDVISFFSILQGG